MPMKKMMLIGSTSSGKTTLTQALYGHELVYRKTQAMEYSQYMLDTPGEFIENRHFYSALMTSSVDYDVIGLVHDCTRKNNHYPPCFTGMFNRPAIGIITKIDSDGCDVAYSREILKAAGAHTLFEISSVTGEGLAELKAYLGVAN